MTDSVAVGITAGLVGADLRELRIPEESEYVAMYCARTGRKGIDNLGFYIAFNMFRFAAILHGADKEAEK